jgi:hypothetical protein
MHEVGEKNTKKRKCAWQVGQDRIGPTTRDSESSLVVKYVTVWLFQAKRRSTVSSMHADTFSNCAWATQWRAESVSHYVCQLGQVRGGRQGRPGPGRLDEHCMCFVWINVTRGKVRSCGCKAI